MSATTQFGEVFKNEHRAIRDALLNLIHLFRNRDVRETKSRGAHLGLLRWADTVRGHVTTPQSA